MGRRQEKQRLTERRAALQLEQQQAQQLAQLDAEADAVAAGRAGGAHGGAGASVGSVVVVCVEWMECQTMLLISALMLFIPAKGMHGERWEWL